MKATHNLWQRYEQGLSNLPTVHNIIDIIKFNVINLIQLFICNKVDQDKWKGDEVIY